MNVIALLEQSGLSKGEATVYAALSRLGPATPSKIAAQTGLRLSTVNYCVSRLKRKSLVETVIVHDRSLLKAANLETLLSRIARRREKLRVIEASLKRRSHMLTENGSQTSGVRLLEGYAGVKKAFKELLALLEPGDEHLVVGARSGEPFDSIEKFLVTFHRKRAAKKVRCKIIYNRDVIDTVARKRARIPLTESRVMPAGVVTPTAVHVFKDTVMLLAWIVPPSAVIISSAPISASFKEYFKMLWRESRPFSATPPRKRARA